MKRGFNANICYSTASKDSLSHYIDFEIWQSFVYICVPFYQSHIKPVNPFDANIQVLSFVIRLSLEFINWKCAQKKIDWIVRNKYVIGIGIGCAAHRLLCKNAKITRLFPIVQFNWHRYFNFKYFKILEHCNGLLFDKDSFYVSRKSFAAWENISTNILFGQKNKKSFSFHGYFKGFHFFIQSIQLNQFSVDINWLHRYLYTM